MKCPDAAKLRLLLDGKLPAQEFAEIERHVEECSACKSKLQEALVATTYVKAGQPADVNSPRPSPAYAYLAPAKRPGELGRLGHYRVLQQLGQGGMGTVFLAEDINLERRVALKVMATGYGDTQTARQRFIREAQSAAAIEHDNIVTVFQVGQQQGVLFLAMQLLEGESLEDRLKREGKLASAEAVRIARDVAQGMQAAHEKGLIHRDIKPSNLWLDKCTGRTVILDFGLARQVTDNNKLTKLGEIIGTPAYLSPEQACGEKVDHRTDLFSLGTVLYQMVTGRRPFQGSDTASLVMAIIEDPPPPPEKVDASVPAALSNLIMRMLEKKRDQRPASAEAVVEGLIQIEKRLAPTRTAFTDRSKPIIARASHRPKIGMSRPLLAGMLIAITKDTA